MLAVVVHPASIPDRAGGRWVLAGAGNAFPRLQHIWADLGYTGTLVRWAAQEHGWTVQAVSPQFRQIKRYAPEFLADLGDEPGFKVIPKRWIVERTFLWIGRPRRLSKEYERLASTEETFVYLVGIRLLLARLAPAWKGKLFKHLIRSVAMLNPHGFGSSTRYNGSRWPVSRRRAECLRQLGNTTKPGIGW